MLGTQFYNEAVRKTVISFGTLFNNIELKKTVDGQVLETEKVPLAYGPKQKFLYRLQGNPTDGRKVAITLPRLYFEMSSIEYDGSRKTTALQKYRTVIDDNGTEVKTQYVPVPYNIGFELGVIAKSQDDGLQILEQILPFFQPSLNVSIKFIPDMDEIRDVSIVLNNINFEDDWEDDFTTRRSITYTLSFTAKSYIYGPYTKADVIRKSRVIETIGDLNVNKRHVELNYTPKATVDYNQDGQVDAADDAFVTADDDFGFNEGVEFL
jgi:hypothetical protein|tara:strand:+ start:442 stop:1239 length:798 start_codon:yes stop_codon:yes gene_type:complete